KRTPWEVASSRDHRGGVAQLGFARQPRLLFLTLLQPELNAPTEKVGRRLAATAAVAEPGADPGLIPPKGLEPVDGKLRVPHRRGDAAVAQVVLYRPCVVAIIRQLVSGRVPEHVRVDEEREPRRLTSPSYHALVAGHTQGSQTLANEDVG